MTRQDRTERPTPRQVGGRPHVSEPNAADHEVEGREAIEAELGGKFPDPLAGG